MLFPTARSASYCKLRTSLRGRGGRGSALRVLPARRADGRAEPEQRGAVARVGARRLEVEDLGRSAAVAAGQRVERARAHVAPEFVLRAAARREDARGARRARAELAERGEAVGFDACERV